MSDFAQQATASLWVIPPDIHHLPAATCLVLGLVSLVYLILKRSLSIVAFGSLVSVLLCEFQLEDGLITKFNPRIQDMKILVRNSDLSSFPFTEIIGKP